MSSPMLLELMGYSTALVVMQRLESRHSLLKRFLAWRHKQMPATLSAALRRKENRDLENSTFQSLLPELLTSIGELDPGEWQSKTQFLERVSRASALAVHDPLKDQRSQVDTFREQLAVAAGHKCLQPESGSDLSLMREHCKLLLQKGKFYALQGYTQEGAWCVFRVLSTNPGQNMYLQRSCYLSTDAACLV